jgi:hypothetical protein
MVEDISHLSNYQAAMKSITNSNLLQSPCSFKEANTLAATVLESLRHLYREE